MWQLSVGTNANFMCNRECVCAIAFIFAQLFSPQFDNSIIFMYAVFIAGTSKTVKEGGCLHMGMAAGPKSDVHWAEK